MFVFSTVSLLSRSLSNTRCDAEFFRHATLKSMRLFEVPVEGLESYLVANIDQNSNTRTNGLQRLTTKIIEEAP